MQESAMDTDQLTLGTALRMSFYDLVIGSIMDRVLPKIETIALDREKCDEKLPRLFTMSECGWWVAGDGSRMGGVALAGKVGRGPSEPRTHDAWSTRPPSGRPATRS